MRHLARVLLVACVAACSTKKSDSAPPAGDGATLPDGRVFTRAAMLQSVGDCTYKEVAAFRSAAETLASVTSQAAQDASKRADARDAWKRAMVIWQRLETMQFGPAAPSSVPGGAEIREPIYSWPLAARCFVEQNLVSKQYESPTFAQGLVNTRGMLAAEYLLFYEGTDNACIATAAINAQGTWAAMGAAELGLRKAAHAKVVADDVLARATALADAWTPGKGNFLGELARAGKGSQMFPTDQLALNSMSEALFYLDGITKDLKLGKPAGLTACTTPTCPEALESQFAGASKEHVRNNLLGFRQLFFGCDDKAFAFEEHLLAIGAGDLAKQIADATTAALAAVDAIEEPDLLPALSADLASVKALHAAVKRITDLLKSQFLSVLDLEIPKRFATEGDND